MSNQREIDEFPVPYTPQTKDNRTPHDIPRGFTGIWIPRDIWLHPELSFLEKCLWAEIDSLDREVEGCTATNRYFSKLFDLHERKIREHLSKLRGLGLIKYEGENGRMRIIRSLFKAGKVPEKRSKRPIKIGVPSPKSDSALPDDAGLKTPADIGLLSKADIGPPRPWEKKPQSLYKIENKDKRTSSSSPTNPGSDSDSATQKMRKKFFSLGFSEEQIERGWEEFLKKPEGSVKNVEKWLLTVLRSIRLSDDKKAQLRERAEEILEKRKKDLERAPDKAPKENKASLPPKPDRTQLNLKVLKEFSEEFPGKCEIKKEMYRFRTGMHDLWMPLEEWMNPEFLEIVKEYIKEADRELQCP